MNEPIFLGLDEVLRIHARSLAEHGGSQGVRDLGLVESALASAKNVLYYAGGDWFDVAAGYAFHLAESQAFITALVFLARSGIYATPATWELYNCMIDVAEKKKSKADLAEIFRKRATE